MLLLRLGRAVPRTLNGEVTGSQRPKLQPIGERNNPPLEDVLRK